MNTLQKSSEYINKHEELIATFEYMVALIHQMSGEQYPAMDVYINNCNHLHTHYGEAMKILSYAGFSDYIIKNDPELYYHLQSMILSFKIISNMLNNLNAIIKKQQQSCHQVALSHC